MTTSPAEECGRQPHIRPLETKPAVRDASPTRVFLGAEAAEGDASVLHAPAWIDAWRRVAERAFAGWQAWELPVSPMSSFWKNPQYHPELSLQRHAGQGTAPYLLALLATFPRSSRACREASDQLLCFFLWDDWLKHYGGVDDFAGLAAAFQPGPSQVGDSQDPFPRGLERKYPGRRRALLEGAARHLSGSGGAWLPRYRDSWLLYAQGLRMHRELADSARDGSTPALADFLVCRGLSGGALLWLVLAAANAGVPPLGARAFQAALPFLAAAAMYAAVFGDLYLALRRRDEASASPNIVAVYDIEEAVLVHNALLASVAQQGEALLQAGPLLSQSGGIGSGGAFWSVEPLAALVEVVQAAVHGLVAWHEFPSRFQSLAVQPVPYFASRHSPPAAPAWLACQISTALQRTVAVAQGCVLGPEGTQL